MRSKEEYWDRNMQLIQEDKVIVLKKDNWYLGQHNNLAGSVDYHQTCWRASAMQFEDLEWAFIVAKHFGYKVKTYKVKRVKP